MSGLKTLAFDFETILDLETLHLIPEKKPREQKDPLEKASTDSNFIRPVVAGFCDGEKTWTYGLKSPTVRECQDCEACIEKCLLAKTWDTLKWYDQYVGFNSREFDCELLIKRSWLNRVPASVRLDLAKYRYGNHIDLRDALSNWDSYARGDLDFYIALKFGEKKDDITGADIGKLWGEGNYAKVHIKCEKDCQYTYRLFESMAGLYF